MTASIWNPGAPQTVPALPAVAPVSFVKGTQTNPGINFVGDPETGLWSRDDGYIDVVCNGQVVATLNPSGNVVAKKFTGSVEVDLASASVTDIGAQTTNFVRITGNNSITSFGTNYSGPIFVRFASALTLTHNANTLILPGNANISINAGDTLIAVPKATGGVSNGWFVVGYSSPSPLLNNVTSINGGQLAGLRNRIINGNFNIWQRGISGTSSNNYSLDRWISFSAGTAHTWSQVAGGPLAGVYFSSLLQIAGAAGNTGVTISQRIESLNSADLTGQTVTFSAYVLHTGTGGAMNVTITTQHPNAADNWSYGTTIANSGGISVPLGTWKRITWTTTLPASGPNLGLSFELGLGAVTAGQSFFLTGVQLEVGSVATPFEQRPYGMELALCQRYYEKSYDLSDAVPTVTHTGKAFFSTNGAGNLFARYGFKVTKRTSPTIRYFDLAGALSRFSSSHVNGNSVNAGGIVVDQSGFYWDVNFTGIGANAKVEHHWDASAEL